VGCFVFLLLSELLELSILLLIGDDLDDGIVVLLVERFSEKVTDALFVFVVFQIVSLVVLPDQFLELGEVAEEGDAPSPVHEGRFQYPEIGVGFTEEGFGAAGFAVEIALRTFVQLLR
jgi:hypothetical protein